MSALDQLAAAGADVRAGRRARWIADEYGMTLDQAQGICAEVDAEAEEDAA